MAKTILNVIILILPIISESALLHGVNCETYSEYKNKGGSKTYTSNLHKIADSHLNSAHGEKILSSSINISNESRINDFIEDMPEKQKLEESCEKFNSQERNYKKFLSDKDKKDLKQTCWIGKNKVDNHLNELKGEEITLRVLNLLN